jgi:hypothetical protein
MAGSVNRTGNGAVLRIFYVASAEESQQMDWHFARISGFSQKCVAKSAG